MLKHLLGVTTGVALVGLSLSAAPAKANTRLGWFNIYQYCSVYVHEDAEAVNTTPTDYRGWRCKLPNGGFTVVNYDDVCRAQYGDPSWDKRRVGWKLNAFAKLSDPYDPSSPVECRGW